MKKQKSTRKKVWTMVGLVFLLILLVVGGFSLYFIRNIEEKSTRFLIEKVEGSTGHLYSLDIGKIRINLPKRAITLSNITFKINEEALKSDTVQLPSAFYRLEAKKIELSANHFLAALRKKSELVINKLEIIEPEILMFPQKNVLQDTVSNKEPHHLLPSFIHGLTLKEIVISNGSFKRYDVEKTDSLFFKVDGINLHLHTLYFNLENILSEEVPLFAQINSQFNETKCYVNDYEISLKGINFNGTTRNAKIDSLFITPLYNKYIFPEKTQRPTAAEITVHDIAIFNLHVEELFYNHRIFIDSIILAGYEISTFRNKNIPLTPIIKPLFSQMVLDLKVPLKIDKVIIHKGNIHHEEIARHKNEIGTVLFNNIRGTIKNVTNIIDTMSSNCEFNIRGRIYNTGDITLHYSFPIDTQTTHYHLDGKIRNLKLSEVNNISVAAANINVDNGVISEMTFSISADHRTSKAEILMLYHDFKVSLLKSDHERKRWFISELANDFVLISDNPKGNKPPRMAHVTLKRNPYYFQFHHLWNTLFLGIKESVGIGSKEEKMIQKHR